jgi:hypothetical protein
VALIGALGDITFHVSRNAIKTFDNMKWSSGAKYASHDVHLQAPKLEYTGIESDNISFDMSFSVFYGIDPVREINNIARARITGEAMRLVIGNKIYGRKWVITKTSKDLEKFDNHGNLLAVKINVSLQAYN